MATGTLTHRTIPRRLQTQLLAPMPLPGGTAKTLEGRARVSGSSGDSRNHSRAPRGAGCSFSPPQHPERGCSHTWVLVTLPVGLPLLLPREMSGPAPSPPRCPAPGTQAQARDLPTDTLALLEIF